MNPWYIMQTMDYRIAFCKFSANHGYAIDVYYADLLGM